MAFPQKTSLIKFIKYYNPRYGRPLADPMDILRHIFNSYSLIKNNSANFANIAELLRKINAPFANSSSN